MARLNVNPTRMEQQKQKSRERTARRGHKLLKDKSDEMIRRFLSIMTHNRELRADIEAELAKALHFFMLARAQMTEYEIEAALSCNAATAQKFTAGVIQIMGLSVPKILPQADADSSSKGVSITTTADFDKAVRRINRLLVKLAELANIEKTCDMLASEIERTRRRLNALEYIMIPQIQETIKFITMKLAENERGNQVRLMKVKEMINAQENAE